MGFILVLLVALSAMKMISPLIRRAYYRENEFGWGGPVCDNARLGHWDEVRKLLKAGADPNDWDERKRRSALMRAACCGPRDVVELLLAKGATPDEPEDDNGEKALDYAKARGNDKNQAVIIRMIKQASHH